MCSSDLPEPTTGPAFAVEVPQGDAQSGLITVEIQSSSPTTQRVQFIPDVVKITVGSTVRWTNARRSASSATSHSGQEDSWDSGSFSKGTFDKEAASFEHTFNIPGCFTYKSLFSGDTATGAVCVVE